MGPEGSQGAGALVIPRFVFHARAPVVALTAYSLPSQEPKYAMPPVTVGVVATGAPVWNDHRCVSVGTVLGEIEVSLDDAVRCRSCSEVGQSSVVAAARAGVVRVSARYASAASKAR